jgi:hypothetical protein
MCSDMLHKVRQHAGKHELLHQQFAQQCKHHIKAWPVASVGLQQTC